LMAEVIALTLAGERSVGVPKAAKPALRDAVMRNLRVADGIRLLVSNTTPRARGLIKLGKTM
jgi:hypothetical protein